LNPAVVILLLQSGNKRQDFAMFALESRSWLGCCVALLWWRPIVLQTKREKAALENALSGNAETKALSKK
jgi:hypothetical protein